MSRIGTLLVALLLTAGCGGDDAGEAQTAATTAAWAERDCTPAGSRAGTSYRVCYASPSRRAIERGRDGRFERLEVADPPGARVGHWRWAALSPDGTTLLAQWSAECEVPYAFLVPAGGGEPRLVTGERDWTEAPESQALGWTTAGEPIVHLPKGVCGRGASTPGTYVVGDGGPRRVDATLDPSLEPRDVG
jgi:hypothetical protein